MILSDIAEVIMGQAPPGTSYNENGNGLPLLAGASDLGAELPSPSRYTSAAKKVSKDGDIILCVRATIGKLNWSDGQYCLGRGVSGVRALDAADSEFLYYFLAANERTLLNKGRGATFKQISKGDITELEIPEEPYRNKAAIVARIQECLSRVEEMERLQADVAEDLAVLTHSGANKFFKEQTREWPTIEIGEVLKLSSGQSLTSEKMAKNGNIPVYGGNGITGYHDRAIFDEKKLVVGRVGAHCGAVHITTDECWITDNALYAKEIHGDWELDFLAHALRSLELNQFARRAAQPVVSGKVIYPHAIPIGISDDQKRISEKMNQFRQSVQLASQISEEFSSDTTALRNAILRQAFAGEL